MNQHKGVAKRVAASRAFFEKSMLSVYSVP